MIHYTYTTIAIIETPIAAIFEIINNIINNGEELIEIYNGGE